MGINSLLAFRSCPKPFLAHSHQVIFAGAVPFYEKTACLSLGYFFMHHVRYRAINSISP